MSSDHCFGSSLLLSLPNDVFALFSRSLSPRDICSLSMCCRRLHNLTKSDELWLYQCEMVGFFVSPQELVEWRKAVSSYKVLCRFLFSVQPLIGLWIHQYPEPDNVVYVMPGFVSVVGCRIILQQLHPLGIEDGPILWAPVFEILGDSDGSAVFILHGREGEIDYIYPGSMKSIERTCNALLLEVEPRQQKNRGKLVHSESVIEHLDEELSRQVYRCSESGVSRSQRVAGEGASMVPFSQLDFDDRRKLLEIVMNQVCDSVPDSASGPLFPHLRDDERGYWKNMKLLSERRSTLMHLLEKSISVNGSCTLMKNKSSCIGENKHDTQLHDFLRRAGETIGLTLHASTKKLSYYQAWPMMHDSQFALYKLPMQVPTPGQEYAGVWGGTFGWPPGKPTDDERFLLLLTYQESRGQRCLIATKMLEGTDIVQYPNGSAMFVVYIDKPSQDVFPLDIDAAGSHPVNIEHTFTGEGIAHGYGFRYPRSKPGSLFVIQDRFLAFIWRESRDVLTLQRLNLQELLKKGERWPPLPPIDNFSSYVD